MEDMVISNNAKPEWQPEKNGHEEKKAAVELEMQRLSKLPPNSAYGIHRMRVVNKILQLLSLQMRTVSQDEELELLFAGLRL